MGHQLAGGNRSWCPKLECWTTHTERCRRAHRTQRTQRGHRPICSRVVTPGTPLPSNPQPVAAAAAATAVQSNLAARDVSGGCRLLGRSVQGAFRTSVGHRCCRATRGQPGPALRSSPGGHLPYCLLLLLPRLLPVPHGHRCGLKPAVASCPGKVTEGSWQGVSKPKRSEEQQEEQEKQEKQQEQEDQEKEQEQEQEQEQEKEQEEQEKEQETRAGAGRAAAQQAVRPRGGRQPTAHHRQPARNHLVQFPSPWPPGLPPDAPERAAVKGRTEAWGWGRRGSILPVKQRAATAAGR